MKINQFQLDLWTGLNIVWILALVIANLWYGLEPRWVSSILWNIFFVIHWILFGISCALIVAVGVEPEEKKQ